MGYINRTSGSFLGLFFLIASVLSVTLRFLARYTQKARRGWDDWLCIPSMLISCVMGITLYHAAQTGLLTMGPPPTSQSPVGPPAPMPDMSQAQHEGFGILFVFHVLQLLSLGLIKTSVLLFYRRIFNTGGNRVFHWASVVMIVLTIAWTIGFLPPLAMPCKPPQTGPPQGGPPHMGPPHTGPGPGAPTSGPGMSCTGIIPLQHAFALSDFLMDVLVILFPLPAIWGLQMTTSRKLAVSGIFALGCLSVAASAARVAFLGPTMKPGFSEDQSHAVMFIGDTLFWGMMETGIALVAACLPTFRFLFTRVGGSGVFRSLRARWGSGRWSRLSGRERSRGGGQDEGRGVVGRDGAEVGEKRPMHKELPVAGVSRVGDGIDGLDFEEIDTVSMAKHGGIRSPEEGSDVV